jgi:hypothetical protein
LPPTPSSPRAGGIAPIPVSSGKTNRHRLDRGGNRQINTAIHSVAITRARCHPETKAYRVRAGGKPATPPARARFWVGSIAARGSQALTWSVKKGRWAVVVMRPDGSRGVSADVAAGAKMPGLLWASIGLLVFGLLTLGGAGALIYFGARERRVAAPPARERTRSGDR